MSTGTIIAQREALQELAETWEQDAGRIARYDPDAARYLSACAEDLRRLLGEEGVEWVPLTSVQAWTGWSFGTLRRRCTEELAPAGAAEKRTGGRWYVTMEVALAWPVKETGPEAGADLMELAKLAGREG